MVSIRQITTPDTTTSGAVGQSSGKVKITQIKAGTPTGSLPTSTSGGVNLNQVEAPKVTIKQLNEKTNAFSSPSEVKTSKVTIKPIQPEQPQKKSFFQSLEETVLGGVKNTGASDVNALGNLYDIGQNRRTSEYIEQRDQYKKELDRWKNAYAEEIASGTAKPGDSYYENIIADLQRKYDAFNTVVEGEVQQKATQATYEMADKISESAAENIAKAKELTPLPGLVGDIAVDAGASLVQTAGDALGNAVLGGPSMLPFAFRAYGGGTQAARKDGADTLGKQVAYGVTSAAKEVFTEKMFNIASPFKKVYGEGTMDDLMTKAIDKVVGKLVKSEAGKKAITQLVSGAVGEGLEEFIGDWMEWQMPRIYNGDVDSAADTLSQSLYDFAVGAASGLIGDIGGKTFEAGINKIAGNNQNATAKKTEAVKAEIGASRKSGVKIQTIAERQAQFAQAEKIANNFGAQFKIEALQNGVSGEYKDGTITIDPNTKNPVRSVLVHELTHYMEASGTYNDFSNLVLNYISKDMGADIDALKRSIITEYAEGGFELTDADAQKELVAKFAESKLFQDEKAINRLCRENRTVFQQIYDWITDTIAMVRGTSEERFLINAQRMYENALRGQENAQKTGKVTITPVSAQARQLFAGEGARIADFNALTTAKQMESQGSDAESIRKATGWFRGMDGKWRFEIADNNIGVDTTGLYSRNPDVRRFSELTKMAYFDMNATEEQLQELQILDKNLKGVSFAPKYLDEIVSHPSLFEAYPELRDVRIVLTNNMNGVAEAAYAPGFKEIVVKRNTILEKEKLKKNLIHEIQHAIQNIEGFASGTNMQAANDAIKERIDELTAEKLRLYKAEDDMLSQLDSKYLKMYEDATLSESEIDAMAEKEYAEFENKLKNSELGKAIQENAAELNRLNKTSGYEYYRNTAGEIEARNAAERLSYSSEDRQSVNPDIRLKSDVFFAEGSGLERSTNNYSISNIQGENGDYGPGVILDTEIFNGVSPRNWGKVLGKYVYEQMAGKPLVMYDENGVPETVMLAKANDRVKKDGAKNSHKVIDKLARYTGNNIKALATIQLDEALATSRFEDGSSENNHQWLDENGWEHRKTVLQDKNGKIYSAILNIADGRNGKILYDISLVNEIDSIKKATDGAVPSSVSGRGSLINSSLQESILDNDYDVKLLPTAEEIMDPDSEYNKAIQFGRDSQDKTLSENQQKYFKRSQVRDAAGRLIPLYHQTGADFTVFDTEAKGSGASDYMTPKGIFLKPTSRDIGLKGKKQMALYANITNMLNVTNRQELESFLKNDKDIARGISEIDAINARYGKLSDDANDEFIEYTKTHKGENGQRLSWDDEGLQKLIKNEQNIIDEWTNIVNMESARVKQLTTDYLMSQGYDGVHILNDEGSFGRMVETYIAFNSNQVKSINNANPTDNPDITKSYGRDFNQLLGDTMRLKTAEEILAEEPVKVEAETEAPEEPKYLPTAEDIIKDAQDKGYELKRASDLEEPKYLPTAEEIMARDKLPAKASTYLRGVEKGLFNRLSGVLDAAKFEDKGFIQEAVRDISNEYLQTGKISEETVDRLFNAAYDQAIVLKEDRTNVAKDAASFFKGHRVYVPEYVKHEFSDDWNAFRKSMLGYGLTLTNDANNAGVDEIVQEANGMFGNLFDEYDQKEALLQIQSMFEEANNNTTTLSEKYGGEEEDFRAWAKRDFEIAVNDTISELNRVKRYSDERLAKAAEEHKITPEEIENAYSVLRTRRKAAEKAVAKNLLTEKDEAVVGRLLRGEMQLEDVDPEQFNYKGIKAVYEAKAQYEEVNKIVKKASKARKEELRAEAAKYLKDANQWKDKGAGILYSRETMWRNLRDIVQGEVSAQQVIDYLLTPIRQNNAKQTKFLNKHRDTIKDLNLSRKIEAGNEVSESYAVQLLGEAEDNIRTIQESKGRIQEREGKTVEDWKGEIDNLKIKNPKLDWDKINIAIETFRAEYDEMLMQANEVLVRNGYEPIPRRKGYFPHFQNEDTDGVFGTFKKLFGIETEVTDLPTTINGLIGMFRPGKTWFGNAIERQGIHTDYDAVKGFDKYVQGISDVIYHTDDIQRVRAFAAEARYRTSDEGLQKQIDEIRANDFLTEMEKDTRIAELYHNGEKVLSHFVVELDEYANLLANKKSRSDREIETDAGRKIYDFLKTTEGNIASNMVAVNPGSWLTNFIPITQAWSTVDSQSILKGMADTLKGYKSNDGFVAKSDYLTSRFGSDPLIERWNQDPNAKGLKKVGSAWRKGVDKLSGGMDVVDNFTSETIVRARYNYNIKNGMSEVEAMREADQWAAALQAGRSKGEMPTLFSRKNPRAKLMTQFQLEVNNEFSWLVKDVPDELKKRGLAALAAGLWKFLIGSFIYNEVYEYFVGRRSALDPIGILNESVGDFTGYKLPNLVEAGRDAIIGRDVDFTTDKKDLYSAATSTLQNIGEEAPFIGNVLGGGRLPAGNVLPDFTNLVQALLNDNWSREKKIATLRKELIKPVAYGLIPGAGSQVKKTVEGIEAIVKGGSYSVDKNGNQLLQYPVYKDETLDKVAVPRVLLFGKSSAEEARKWVESGFNTLSAKETALYQQLVENEVTDREAWKFINDFTSISKTDEESANALKRKYISESDVSGEAKCLALSSMLTSDKDITLLEGLLSSGSNPEDVAQALIAVKDADSLKKGNGKAIREAIYNSKLEDSDKLAIYIAKASSSKTDEIKDCLEAGLTMDDFLRFNIDIYGIESDKAKTKQEKVVEIIDSYNLTEEQKNALYLVEYKVSGLDDTPWNNPFALPKYDLPEFDLPEFDLPDEPKYLPYY